MSEPDLTEAEVEAVVNVLRSGQLSLGPQAGRFEQQFAAYIGVAHAVAVSGGTAALHLALIAAGVTEGDVVITSPFSFVASANSILYERAIPLFVDVDATTGNIDPAGVEDAIARLPPERRSRLKALLPVHVFGRPVDMTGLMRVARSHGLAVIEDACEAVGAEWSGRRVGAFGDAGCFGFYPNKQMTTGEGGMIVTGDAATAALCRSLRNQGRDHADQLRSYRLGYNYRLPDVACAIGLVQLERLDELQRKRARVAAWYEARVAGVAGVSVPPAGTAGMRLSWFVYVVRFTGGGLRAAAEEALAAAGIPSRRYFHPIHLQPHFVERFGYAAGAFPNAEHLSDICLALPFSSTMRECAVDRVCSVLREVLNRETGGLQSG
jgi:perosamine synthetase